MKPIVRLLVGLPGSGKSTYSKEMSEIGWIVVSSDAIRKELYGSEEEQGNGEEVFGLVRERALDALSGGRNVIIDATHLYRTSRAVCADYKVQGYSVEAVMFDVPLGVCLERNRNRARHVPEDVMQRMSDRMSAPTLDEGFDQIIWMRGDTPA